MLPCSALLSPAPAPARTLLPRPCTHHRCRHYATQVRDLLLSRDAAERELASERAFNEELNRILSDIRAEQQQQAVALEERAY